MPAKSFHAGSIIYEASRNDGVQNAHINRAFAMDESGKKGSVEEAAGSIVRQPETRMETEVRSTWNNGIEFLMSCIAMSIGFGNIWRFPFVAYDNGGGVFLIPYIIVLFLVGKPFYYLEMILGQFTSSSSIKVWHVSPAFAGNYISYAGESWL